MPNSNEENDHNFLEKKRRYIPLNGGVEKSEKKRRRICPTENVKIPKSFLFPSETTPRHLSLFIQLPLHVRCTPFLLSTIRLFDRFAVRRVRSTLSGELRRGREATAAGQPVVRREPGIGILDPEQPGTADHPRDNRLRSAYRLASRNHHPHHVAIAPRRTHRPLVSTGGRPIPSPPPQDGDRDRESHGIVAAASASPSSSSSPPSPSAPPSPSPLVRGYDHRDDDNHRRESHRDHPLSPCTRHSPTLFLSRNVRPPLRPHRGSSRATRLPSPRKIAVRRRSSGRRLAAHRSPHRQVRIVGGEGRPRAGQIRDGGDIVASSIRVRRAIGSGAGSGERREFRTRQRSGDGAGERRSSCRSCLPRGTLVGG